MFRLADIVPKGATVAALRSSDREGAVRELIALLVKGGSIPPNLADELARAVLDRERKTSTGVGCGVAVPHAKHAGVKAMTAAIGLSARGLDFSSLDRQPVFSVVLLLSPADKPDEHLRAMEAIFRHLGKESFRRQLRQAQTDSDIRELLLDNETSPLAQ